MERWRRAPIPETVDHDDEWFDAGDGRQVVDYLASWSEEDIGRFREGYLCLVCWEPQETAFPETCSVCGYEMSKRQTHDFARLHRGYRDTSPRSKIDDEIERMRDERERRLWTPDQGIAVAKKIVSKRVTTSEGTVKVALPPGVRDA